MLPTGEAFVESTNEEPAGAIPIPSVMFQALDQSQHGCLSPRMADES